MWLFGFSIEHAAPQFLLSAHILFFEKGPEFEL